MEFVALITLLILIQYKIFMGFVGKARVDSGIKAPAITGDERFECALRVQLNTLEQMVVTIPAMWLCAYFVSPSIAAALGGVFIVGRIFYRNGYMKDPAKRASGMIMGYLANVIMVVSTLWYVVAGVLSS